MLRLDASVRPALRTIAGAVLLFAGTVALYTRVLAYGFTNYDDPRYLTNNPPVQGGFTAESLRWAFVGKADYFRECGIAELQELVLRTPQVKEPELHRWRRASK